MKKFVVLLICFTGALLFGQTDDDFTIENGELEEYRGAGGTVVIPGGISGIDEGAFSGNRDIVAVNIPAGVTHIGAYAFRGCERLTAVNLTPGLTAIGEYAFASCKSLAAITIPGSVTVIGAGAFSGCTGLYAVIMSRKTRLGRDVFKGAPVNILYID
ncbi:hypothetical protein AGMMS49546_24250 [Spirochaetia bacterium]|nr:hypothetical protein AGMMS49546_24060 [Spirochaetia bacterium]GHV43238.1 hypothetical protein AGMMS49546_24250 [Spirochaetia bacterium]